MIRISRRRDRLRVPDRQDAGVIDLAAAEKAVGKLVSQGYGREEYTRSELGCRQDAVTALNMAPEALALTLYLGGEDEARNIATQLFEPVAAQIRAEYFCD